MEQQTEQMQPNIKETLLKFYSSRTCQVILDIVRILMLISVVFLIYYMIKNVEMVKLLNSDVCKICMDSTNCSCFCGLNG